MQIKDHMKKSVVAIPITTTIGEAAALIVKKHVGILPIVDELGKPVGLVRVGDLLALEMPDFIHLVSDFDFVHDFGAVETARPSPEELERPAVTLMQPVTFVEETCGLLRAYALMVCARDKMITSCRSRSACASRPCRPLSPASR